MRTKESLKQDIKEAWEFGDIQVHITENIVWKDGHIHTSSYHIIFDGDSIKCNNQSFDTIEEVAEYIYLRIPNNIEYTLKNIF